MMVQAALGWVVMVIAAIIAARALLLAFLDP